MTQHLSTIIYTIVNRIMTKSSLLVAAAQFQFDRSTMKLLLLVTLAMMVLMTLATTTKTPKCPPCGKKNEGADYDCHCDKKSVRTVVQIPCLEQYGDCTMFGFCCASPNSEL